MRTISTISILLAPIVLASGCHKTKQHEQAPIQSLERAPPPERVKAVGQLGPGRGTLVVSLEPGQSGKLTEGAPLSLEAHGDHLHFPARLSEKLRLAQLPLRIPIDVEDGATGPAFVKLSYYWCGATKSELGASAKIARADDAKAGSSCRQERADLIVDLDTSGDAPGGEAHLVHRPN